MTTNEENKATIDETAILTEARREYIAFQETMLDLLESLLQEGYFRLCLAPHRRSSYQIWFGDDWYLDEGGTRFRIVWFELTGEVIAVELEKNDLSIVLPQFTTRFTASGRYLLLGICNLKEVQDFYAGTTGCGSLAQWYSGGMVPEGHELEPRLEIQPETQPEPRLEEQHHEP